MKLQMRINQIVTQTVEDFYSFGKSIDETKSETIEWINNTLRDYEDIEDYTTIEISLKVLEMLKSLDIVDLEHIHKTLFKNDDAVNITLSFMFEEVQNG
jgi:cobalamin biosynthesis Co2+ chelatase CbiK